ncbi:MAG TPA: IS1182 family transposase [Thermoanaerobaculia bacterium]|nr:IS1182 family transposase [Thermoanaerobaculia bacterium]
MKEEPGGSPSLKDLRLRQPNRSQVELKPQSPEDLVEEDDPVRAIWEVTGKLDLSGFYTEVRSRQGQAGRDATDPRLLVALWVYAATQGVGSARELDRLCESHRAYQWLCGGVSLNYHTLSDFRVGHAEALDQLLTQLLVVLVEQNLVKVWRISQDGTRVRACAGASSFRRRDRLKALYEQAKAHVKELRERLEDAGQSAGLSARQQAAQKRAALDRQQRIEKAVSRLPELEEKKLSRKTAKDKAPKLSELRVSTTDAEARVMRMGDGGYRPAINVQLACDADSRAIVGVEVSSQGSDAGLSKPLRQQVEQRTGQKVREHLVDGGYLNLAEIERAEQEQVKLYVPAKVPKNPEKRSSCYEPRPRDSEAILAWRQRMSSPEGQEIYKQRASTSETINADLKCHRGLGQLTVRGLDKVRCVVLWSALAYNLLHFAPALLG